MGLRFRWRATILPGVRLNLSRRGSSMSIGSAPLTTNLSRRGVQTTVSAPGTGVSYVSRRRRPSVSVLLALGLAGGAIAILLVFAALLGQG